MPYPKMNTKDTVFYRGKTSVSLDFSAEEICSVEDILLLAKLVKEHGLFQYFRVTKMLMMSII